MCPSMRKKFLPEDWNLYAFTSVIFERYVYGYTHTHTHTI